MKSNGVIPSLLVLAAGVVVGGLLAGAPLALLAFGVFGLVVVAARKPFWLLSLVVLSELLLPGLGRLYSVTIANVTMNGSVLIDALILGFAILLLVHTRRPVIYRESWPLLGLALAATVSTLIAKDPLLALKGVLKLYSFLVVYSLARSVGSKSDGWTRTLRLVAAVSAAVFTLGFIEYALGYNIISGAQISSVVFSSDFQAIGEFSRIRSTFTHPNQYGLAASIIALICVGEWRTQRSRLFGIVAIAAFFSVILSFSRIAWIGAACGGALMLFFALRGRRLLVTALAAVTAVPVAWWMGSLLIQRATLDSSALLRLRIIDAELQLFKSSPIFGVGYDGFYAQSPSLFGFPLEAHGDYLRLLAETGVVGLLFFAAWLLFPVFSLTRRGLLERDEDLSARSFALAACFLSAAIFALTDNATQGLGLLVLFWGLYDGWRSADHLRRPSQRNGANVNVGQAS